VHTATLPFDVFQDLDHVTFIACSLLLTISSQALKIYIRSRSPQFPEKSAVLLHLEELPERKPPFSDIDAIELYEEALEQVLPESNETWERIIGQLRWQCVKTSPKNEDLSLKCFQACFSKGDLDHARQVSYLAQASFVPMHLLYECKHF
jgi:N-terminal acetyltransferase B complex non-catalytic subunit